MLALPCDDFEVNSARAADGIQAIRATTKVAVNCIFLCIGSSVLE